MFKRLVIVGDSFCADRDGHHDWPLLLASMLKLKLEGKGFPGRSWWSARNWLKSNTVLDKDTLLIVCHTEYTRLPASNDIGINRGLLRTNDSLDANNHLKSIDPSGHLHKLVSDFYMSDLYVEEFYKWANNAWASELDIMASGTAKTIHVPCFGLRDMEALSNVKHSIVAIPNRKESLRALSMKELGDKHYFGYDSRRNHLSDHNNYQLAKALYDIAYSSAQSGFVEFNNLDKWDFTLSKFKNR